MFEKIKELIVESLGIEEDPGNNGMHLSKEI